MSKETPKIDTELAKKFDELIEEQGRKIKPEEQTRKALWALEVLKQENKVNSKTTLTELVQIIEGRKKELRQTDAYAKDTVRGPATDETDAEFRDVAKKEAETAERLLAYMEAAWSTLMSFKMGGYDTEAPLSQIQKRLEGELEIMETAVDRSEENQRHRN